MVKIATKFSSRALGQLPSRDAQADTTAGEGGRDASSEGQTWTRGGGEQSGPTAQFPRLAEQAATTVHAANHAPVRAAAASPAPTPAPAPMASSTSNYTPEQAAALAPVQAAMERFVSRTQDSLAVTVRFEQGGSLSLKLSLAEGGIRTHIQTDVPGLESALRSAWDGFAQDWNQRGVKLGSLTFSPSQSGSSANGGLTDGREHNGHYSADRQGAGGEHLPPGFAAFGSRRGASAGGSPVSHSSPEADHAEAAATISERSLPRGFRTWA